MGGALTASVLWGAQPASAVTAVPLYVATTGNDSGNNCTVMSSPCKTIQNAVNVATGGTYNGDDVTIDVAAGTYDENDTVYASSLDSLTIAGTGATSTTVDGQDDGSVFVTGGTVSISGMTITGGSATDGGGVYNYDTTTLTDDILTDDTATDFGGGLFNRGTATLTDDTLSDDSNNYNFGGGVYNLGTATLIDDTLSDDSSTSGGAFFNDAGTATFTDDTLFDDSATDGDGGALDNDFGSTATLTDDTLSDDSATDGGGGVYNDNGGPTYQGSTATITDSILDQSDCYNQVGAITDGGYNVDSDNTCGFGSTSIVGSSTINLATSLAPNGSSGPETLAIGTNSSAYEEVPQNNCTVTTDERGEPRPGVPGQNCDAGAYEYGLYVSTSSLPNATVSTPYGPITLQAGDQVTGATLKWKKLSLPKGLKLSGAGVLSGTPNKKLVPDQNYTVSVQVTEKYKVGKVKSSQTASASLNLFIS